MQMLASYLKGEIEEREKKKKAVCSHNAGEILCPFALADEITAITHLPGLSYTLEQCTALSFPAQP